MSDLLRSFVAPRRFIWACARLVMSLAGFLSHAKETCEPKIKMKVCWALCRQDGYDTGSYEEKGDSCLCSNRQKFKDLSSVRMKVQRLHGTLVETSEYPD